MSDTERLVRELRSNADLYCTEQTTWEQFNTRARELWSEARALYLDRDVAHAISKGLALVIEEICGHRYAGDLSLICGREPSHQGNHRTKDGRFEWKTHRAEATP